MDVKEKKKRPSRKARYRESHNRKKERRVQKAAQKAAGIIAAAVEPVMPAPEPTIGDRTIIDPSLRWFVVQTFPGYEHRVSMWLKGQGVEHYLPADRIVHVKRGKTHTLIRYALPRHLFLGVPRGQQVPGPRDVIRDHEGRNAQGVYDILRLYGRDVQVPAFELQKFADTLTTEIEARTTPEAQGIKNGDQVLLIDGPFAQFWATVVGPAPGGKIQVEVSVFGRGTPMDIGVDQYEAA